MGENLSFKIPVLDQPALVHRDDVLQPLNAVPVRTAWYPAHSTITVLVFPVREIFNNATSRPFAGNDSAMVTAKS